MDPDLSPVSSRWPKRALWCGLYAGLALLFSYFYLEINHPYPGATPKRLAYFDAEVPYQFRVLVPAIARLVWEITGAPFDAIYFGILFASTTALLFAFRAYVALFVPAPAVASFSAALLILHPLTWNTSTISPWPLWYPSDIPGILLFQLGLIALARDRLAVYYAIFALASLNRESSCFLAFVFLFTRIGVRPARGIAAHIGAQAALWLTIKLALQLVFDGQPGSLVDVMLRRNLLILEHLAVLDWGPSHTAIFTVFGGIHGLILLAWRGQPAFLKRSLWVLAPFVAGMSVVGNLDELRIYGELIPVVTAPAAVALCHRFGWTSPRIPQGKFSAPE